MVVTGETTIENWLDNDTVAYIGACVMLDNNKN
jgi:hypothetical protein